MCSRKQPSLFALHAALDVGHVGRYGVEPVVDGVDLGLLRVLQLGDALAVVADYEGCPRQSKCCGKSEHLRKGCQYCEQVGHSFMSLVIYGKLYFILGGVNSPVYFTPSHRINWILDMRVLLVVNNTIKLSDEFGDTEEASSTFKPST